MSVGVLSEYLLALTGSAGLPDAEFGSAAGRSREFRGLREDLGDGVGGKCADEQTDHGTLDCWAEGAEGDERDAHDCYGADYGSCYRTCDCAYCGTVRQGVVVGRVRVGGDILGGVSRNRLYGSRVGGPGDFGGDGLRGCGGGLGGCVLCECAGSVGDLAGELCECRGDGLGDCRN
jgi:hypothetical protein